MEQLGNVLATIVVFSSLWLVRRLTKREIQNEDLLQKKNDLSSMPLDDYERDLDKVFDYSKITTIALHQEEPVKYYDDKGNITTEEKLVEEIGLKMIAGDDVPGPNNTSTN